MQAIEPSPTSSSADNTTSEFPLLWNVDLHIMPLLYLNYIITLIDRANIGNTKIEGMLADLDMVGNDYNIALIVYAVPFILLEFVVEFGIQEISAGELYFFSNI